MTTDQAAIDALAEAWGEYERVFRKGQWEDPDMQKGYTDEAIEMLSRIRKRGFDIVRKE